MDQPIAPNAKNGATEALPGAASELNNLLQIVSGTVAQLENIWEGTPASEKYFEMLRTSVDRAANVTAQLMKQAGGTEEKKLLAPAPKSPPKRASAPAPRCVLVVDDEPMALMLSRLVLSQAGFEVVTAQSGFEALDLFQKSPGRFALVLLDLSMPILDGEETFRRLRRMDPNITVLLNTGFIEKHHLERMLADGLAGFIRRPYEPSEVIEQIESVLAQKSQGQATLSSR
ncbi:MAG: response regulator [Chthoniobacterales bacterium]